MIDLGTDEDGIPHKLSAVRNLHHRADALCGCNPDAFGGEQVVFRNGSGELQVEETEVFWGHHPFADELRTP